MPNFGGIDLGGTKIQAVVVDDDHNVLGSSRRPTPTSGGPGDVAKEMAAALSDAAKAAELEPASLAGIGVGSPGTIEDGNVTRARNLPGWEGTFPLASTLKDALGADVKVGNDVQVATDAEFKLGAGRLYGSLLGVFWGTGVGAGIASAVNLLDVEGVIIGGGLGVRLGHPYAKRIAEAMQPHLFADSRPPHVHVAALGDLGGAIGAALLCAEL
jgi:predicted NBD/HSP70 family sugar kinase